MDHPLKIKQWDPSKPKRKPNLRARNPELRSALSDASFAQSMACDAENPWPFVGGEDLTNVDPYAGFPSIEEIIDEVIRSATIDNARDSIDTPNHAATPKAISNSIPPYPGDERAGDSVKPLSLQNDTPKRGSNSQEIAIAMEKDKEQGICEMSPKHTIAPVVTPNSIPGRQVDLGDLAGGMPTASKNVVPLNAPLPLVLGGEEPDNDPQSLSVLAQPPPAATEGENHSPQEEEHSDSTEHGDTLEADHCGDIVESTPTESGFGYASPYPTDTSLSSGSTTPSTPPSPSLLSKDETLQNPIQAQAGGTSGQSGLSPMAMDLSQHASSTQEPEVCSSGKQPVDDMRWGRDRCGGDVEPCSTGLGGSRAQAPRRRARGSYMLHGDYYESDDSDGDDNDDNDERGQQSLELDGADRSRRCSGSIPIEALLDDAKYRPAQSTEDSERDHNGDEDEDEDEAYGKRRGKRRRSHEPLASIKRRRYGYTTRQRPTNNTRSVPSDRTPASRMLSPSSSYTTSDDSNTGHDFATFQERRKVSRPSTGLLRNAAVNVERPRRGRPSLRSRSTQSTYRGKNTQARGILSPMSAQATSDETEVKAVLTSFEEWPLENVSLKRITENGKTTFQVQFDWTPCTKHGHASSTVRDRVDLPSTRTRSRVKRASAPRAKYTPQEDDLLIELKEGKEMLAWPEIHQRFCEAHPGRSVESLQVHYSTKLKSRERL